MPMSRRTLSSAMQSIARPSRTTRTIERFARLISELLPELFPNPRDADIRDMPQPLCELAGVVLDVADVVKLELKLVARQPVEAGVGFEVCLSHSGVNLGAAKLLIFEQFRFGVCERGQLRGRETTQHSDAFLVLWPGLKRRFVGLAIEVRVEERVIGDMP